MDYNSQRAKLLMPEYGRLVQEMAQYAVSLPTKRERQQAARTVVGVMEHMFPRGNQIPDLEKRLWDHLAYITSYKLDIDYPFPVERIDRSARPSRLDYPMTHIKSRHYGHLIEQLASILGKMPPSPRRQALAQRVAGKMKRDLADWNKDALSDEKVADDLSRMTDGQIQLSPADMRPPRHRRTTQPLRRAFASARNSAARGRAGRRQRIVFRSRPH